MNKIVIVVLVLIVVVFVIFVTRGSLTKDQPKRGNKDEAAKYEAPNWTKTFKRAFAALGKKVKLDCPANVPPDPDFECKSLPLNTDIKIPPADASFRVVTLVLLKGTAKVEYEDNSEKEDQNFKPDEQDFFLPNFDKEDERHISSVVILEKGGTLKILCQDNKPCQVAQQ